MAEESGRMMERIVVLENDVSSLKAARVGERLAVLETNDKNLADSLARVESSVQSTGARINAILALLVTIIIAIAGWVIRAGGL